MKYDGFEVSRMAEPMIVGAGRPALDSLRIGAQRARDILRSAYEIALGYRPEQNWEAWGIANALQWLDEGSLGVSEMLDLPDSL